MNINEYLGLDENKRLYSLGLKLLHDHGLPEYASQYQLLKAGPMGQNRYKLFTILNKLKSSSPPKAVQITIEKPAVKSLTPSSRTELDLLLALRKAKQKRAQCSQQFHTCKTDNDRAAVCDLIDKATANIKQIEKDLAHVQQFGKLPEKTIQHDPLPETLDELKLESSRISSNILKVEKRISYLEALPPTDKKRKGLAERQGKLQALIARKQACRKRIQKLKAVENG